MKTGATSGTRFGRGLVVVTLVALVAMACGGSQRAETSAQASPNTFDSPRASSPVVETPSPSARGGKYVLGRFPEAPADPIDAATVHELQAILDAAVGSGGLPGISATLIAADEGTWSGAAGTADGTHPVEVASQFAIASITKTVVAAEVMRLSETGALHLADPVSEHLPAGFDFDTNGATVENLLAMESGIPDPALSEASAPVLADLNRRWMVQEVLASVPEGRSPPGRQFVYEDANYMLLGLVVEQTTGMSLGAALRAHILADPRLASMVYQPEERPAGPLALPFLGGQVRPNILELGGGYLPSRSEASNGNGSGCMASDATALALFGYLLFGGTLLSAPSIIAMAEFGTGATYDRYGLGVFDQTDLANGFGIKTIGNAGWDDGGYSTMLAVQPSTGLAISVMTNTAGDPRALVIPIAQTLAAALGD